MADLDLEGNAPKKEVVVDKKPVEGPPQEVSNRVELIPTKSGNELVILVKILESMNRNIAFLANTIHEHLNPKGKKNG